MSLLSPRFNTKGPNSDGSYTVTRYGAGTGNSAGHWTQPSGSTFSIFASVQPLSGRALRDLPEGLRADDVRWVYTNTELRSIQPGDDLYDTIAIEGGDVWRVTKVERFTVLSGHYRATVERENTP